MEDRRASHGAGRKPGSRLLPLSPRGLPALSGASGPQPRTPRASAALVGPRLALSPASRRQRGAATEAIAALGTRPFASLGASPPVRLRRRGFPPRFLRCPRDSPRRANAPLRCHGSGRRRRDRRQRLSGRARRPLGGAGPRVRRAHVRRSRPLSDAGAAIERRRPAGLGRLVEHVARPGSGAADAGGTGPPRAGNPIKDHLRPLFAASTRCR